MDYYDLSQYEWILTLTNKETVRGFFVNYIINKNGVDYHFPDYDKKDFAFCPSAKLKDFSFKRNSLKERPEYVLLFNKEEVNSLNAFIPLHK